MRLAELFFLAFICSGISLYLFIIYLFIKEHFKFNKEKVKIKAVKINGEYYV